MKNQRDLQGPQVDHPDSPPAPEQGKVDKCEERLTDYLNEAINESSPLEANMKIVLAKVIRNAQYVSEYIDYNAKVLCKSPQGFQALQPAFETFTKLAREAEKLAKFATRHEQNKPDPRQAKN